jgi:phosphate transport system substrate-binding protein
MNNLHRNLLATACLALLGTAGMVSGAQAQTCNGDTNCSLGTQPYTFGANDIFGGGSSLIAPYWRQTADCYGQPADLITKGTPPTFVDEDFINTEGQNCATTQIDGTDTAWYISTGSGSGILGLFGHDPVTYWGVVNENGSNNCNNNFCYVSYAASDAGLGSTDVSVYNNGGNEVEGGVTVTVNAPGGSCANNDSNPYPNPAECYGPMIQFPLSIDPVAEFYANGGTYEKVIGSGQSEIDYHFNVQNGTKYGGLRLSVNSLCGIFNGAITNWNDGSLTADNNGTSLVDPKDPSKSGWSVTLIPVARSDSSGTTSIQTRHLANVCQGVVVNGKNNLYTTGATTISGAGAGSIVGQTYNVSNPNWPGVDTAGFITLAPNSSGVAQYVAFTQSIQQVSKGNHCNSGTQLPPKYTTCIQQGRIGYVGADYVLPYVANSQTNVYNLYSADVENAQGQYIAVSPSAASTAFGSVLPPQTTSAGKYQASLTQNGLRNDPTAWVEGLSPSVPLANPQASGSYPVVGTTNFLGYTCYKTSGTLATLSGLINYQETSKVTTNAKKGILSLSGLSVLPKAWTKGIDDAFHTNKDKLNLQPSVAAASGTTPVCEAVFTNGGGA